MRYWDRYWFGKEKSYGDVFPHYWSALGGWSMYYYNNLKKSDEVEEYIKNNLTGNLCIYMEDGFAANNYLYPYKAIQYSPGNVYGREHLDHGVHYGKSYDSWANDQDWALYYSVKILK